MAYGNVGDNGRAYFVAEQSANEQGPAPAPEPQAEQTCEVEPPVTPRGPLCFVVEEAALDLERLAIYCRSMAGNLRRLDQARLDFRAAFGLLTEARILSNRAECAARLLDAGAFAHFDTPNNNHSKDGD